MSDKSIFKQLGSHLKEGLKTAEEGLSGWLSFGSALTNIIDQTKEAVTELKEVETLLTEISRTSSRLSKSDLSRLKDNSFETAGKYGKDAADYLSAVKDALEAGYDNAEGFAELSLALQNAGNMSAELAAQSIQAADESFRLDGSIEKLTALFDSGNAAADRYSLNLAELAEGMSAIGPTALELGISADEAAAAIGTLMAQTGQSGTEAAMAFQAILEQLGKITDTGTGMNALQSPMETLKKLAAEYERLGKIDFRKAGISNVPGGTDSTQLEDLLKNWDTFEEMLSAGKNSAGSMAADAEKTVNSWEGSLNRLSNTWTDTIGNIADSDFIVSIVNGLNGALTVLNKITEAIGPLASVGAGAGLFAGLKNTGIRNHCLLF